MNVSEESVYASLAIGVVDQSSLHKSEVCNHFDSLAIMAAADRLDTVTRALEKNNGEKQTKKLTCIFFCCSIKFLTDFKIMITFVSLGNRLQVWTGLRVACRSDESAARADHLHASHLLQHRKRHQTGLPRHRRRGPELADLLAGRVVECVKTDKIT